MTGGGCRQDSVDVVRMCGPVSTSFSVMALDSVAQFLKGSNPILNAIDEKLRDDPEGDLSASCIRQMCQKSAAAAAAKISEC